MTHQLITITQLSVLLKSKYSIRNPRDTEYTERTCSAVVPDIQASFLIAFDVFTTFSFESAGQLILLRGLRCHDRLISNRFYLCSVHKDQQPGRGASQSPEHGEDGPSCPAPDRAQGRQHCMAAGHAGRDYTRAQGAAWQGLGNVV